ncbi:ankyrin [Polyplosphaeria fusca]|uniref:Ankyrin n=1 Tax=Polyplosphaeria fusca TaxID=682080 RepID=A0A9P4V4V7_9PLEO|nr:ankyrin [Polyplosphaeria fusca]
MKAHAALTICESIVLGFGDPRQDDISWWLQEAARHGSLKASAWLPRVCRSFQQAIVYEEPIEHSVALERCLDELPEHQYFSSRVRLYKLTRLALKTPDTENPESMRTLSWGDMFACSASKDLHEFLMAIYAGDQSLVDSLVCRFQIDDVSDAGFGPIHVACISGRLAILELLLRQGFSASQPASFGISPLHLCIFFPEMDTAKAANVLLESGADPDSYAECILWDDHDLELEYTPLDWAIETRNMELVKSLLPVTPPTAGLRALAASSLFYWEILEFILLGSEAERDGFRTRKYHGLHMLRRTFRHWLAHGTENFQSIDWTLDVFRRNHVPLIYDPREGSTTLMVLITSARTQEDLYLIKSLINILPTIDIKRTNDKGLCALSFSIIVAKDDACWIPIIESLAARYSLGELQSDILDYNSALHIAVMADSITGAQVLLKMGVDVNKQTFDRFKQTPLHLCMSRSGSADMCKLLLQHGADVRLKDQDNMFTPLIRLYTYHKLGSSRMVNEMIRADFPDDVYIESLHALTNRFWDKGVQRPDAIELFGYLLGVPRIGKYVDVVDSDGVTLLQRAAYILCLEAVEILLEVGANVLNGLNYSKGVLYPLQIACVMGRANYLESEVEANSNTNMLESREKDAESALNLCLKLLHLHHTKADNPFRGITDLHIACYIGLPSGIRRFHEGRHATEAKGCWVDQNKLWCPNDLPQEVFPNDLRAVELLGSRLAKRLLGSKESKSSTRNIWKRSSISPIWKTVRSGFTSSGFIGTSLNTFFSNST